jgi:hypothetical protein
LPPALSAIASPSWFSTGDPEEPPVVAIVGRVTIQARERSTCDRKLLGRVVAHDADVGPHACLFGFQRERRHGNVLHVLHRCFKVAQKVSTEVGHTDRGRPNAQTYRRVKLEEAEVVHRVAVDGDHTNLFVVLEHRLCVLIETRNPSMPPRQQLAWNCFREEKCRTYNRSGANDVAVGQDDPALRVDHEASGGAVARRLGVEELCSCWRAWASMAS